MPRVLKNFKRVDFFGEFSKAGKETRKEEKRREERKRQEDDRRKEQG